MKYVLFIMFFIIAGAMDGATAFAQSSTENSVGRSTQKMMLEAANHAVRGEYQKAENLYSKIIILDAGNIDAHLQRGLMARELHHADMAAADARMVITLVNGELRKGTQSAKLYYQRGVGFRILKQFEQAKKDISAAIQMSGKTQWKTDLQAIELEEKMANVR